MTVAGSDFTSPDMLGDDPTQQAAALACLRRHDALDLAGMLGLLPDALCATATGSRRADYARRVRRTRAGADDAQRGAE